MHIYTSLQVMVSLHWALAVNLCFWGNLAPLLDLVGGYKDVRGLDRQIDGRGFLSDSTARWVRQMDTELGLNIVLYWVAGNVPKHKCL